MEPFLLVVDSGNGYRIDSGVMLEAETGSSAAERKKKNTKENCFLIFLDKVVGFEGVTGQRAERTQGKERGTLAREMQCE